MLRFFRHHVFKNLQTLHDNFLGAFLFLFISALMTFTHLKLHMKVAKVLFLNKLMEHLLLFLTENEYSLRVLLKCAKPWLTKQKTELYTLHNVKMCKALTLTKLHTLHNVKMCKALTLKTDNYILFTKRMSFLYYILTAWSETMFITQFKINVQMTPVSSQLVSQNTAQYLVSLLMPIVRNGKVRRILHSLQCWTTYLWLVPVCCRFLVICTRQKEKKTITVMKSKWIAFSNNQSLVEAKQTTKHATSKSNKTTPLFNKVNLTVEKNNKKTDLDLCCYAMA